ncbi:uncharacterized protein A4U43_C09F6610 [Asparagus officinalis]|uniref:Uncharacterized protein n=1 Tax=Asparagus officinalis TaxID=4686 RepID=A0A5P1E7J8_ASPOF|nr:uncharacterized protein A4U43_C09F6610 [Asparagus officinalis]
MHPHFGTCLLNGRISTGVQVSCVESCAFADSAAGILECHVILLLDPPAPGPRNFSGGKPCIFVPLIWLYNLRCAMRIFLDLGSPGRRSLAVSDSESSRGACAAEAGSRRDTGTRRRLRGTRPAGGGGSRRQRACRRRANQRRWKGVSPVLDDGEVEVAEEHDLDDDDEADEERDREIRPSPSLLLLLLRGGAHHIRVRASSRSAPFGSSGVRLRSLRARVSSLKPIDDIARSEEENESFQINQVSNLSGSIADAWFGSNMAMESDCDDAFHSVQDDAFSLNGHEGAFVSKKVQQRDLNEEGE